MVTFKRVEAGSPELKLLEYLNVQKRRDDPWNHSVPVLDIVEHENEALVMMHRLRPFNSPPFQSVAEALDFIRQLLEGLAFFHEHKISRLNLCPTNIGMDTGLLPVTAANWDRSEYNVRYHLIDFSTAYHSRGKESKGQIGEAGWMTHEMVELDKLSEFQPDDIKTLGATLHDIFGEASSRLPGACFTKLTGLSCR
ncbi:hypothetical protein FRB99_002287 [Tulasnella sp. 403]|nr:hypothetical protein FRB99_002287 [Tulasnella sp. 403]